MTLDLGTLLVVSPLVVVTCCVLYLTSSSRRRGMDQVDRCWTLTFVAMLMTTVAYLFSGLKDVSWVANSLGNACFVLALGALWSGVRAFDGRAPRLWIVALATVVTAAASAAPGPDAGAWAGAWAYFLGVAGWSFASAAAILGGRLRSYPAMAALALVAGIFGVFTATRAVIAFTRGFTDPVFTEWVGSEVATVVGMVVAVVGSFAMITVRAPEAYSDRASEVRFDPYLGLRTPASLARQADVAVGRALVQGVPSSVVTVEVNELEEIASAFGRDVARQAFERCADRLVGALPGDVLAGTLPGVEKVMVVVAPATDAACAAELAGKVADALVGLTISDAEVELAVEAQVGHATGARPWRRLVAEATGREARGSHAELDGGAQPSASTT